MKIKKILLIIFIIYVHSLAQDWQIVWQDEFNEDISDDWVFETGYGSWGWGNNEWQYYTSDNAFIRDSNLVIKATLDGQPARRDGSIKSARMKTQHKKYFQYGKIEARIKLPEGQGLWPAFWMLGKDINRVGWPKCGEIDIMENVNGENIIHGTAHWDENDVHIYKGNSVEDVNINDYHKYSIIWDKYYIRWLFDGKEYYRLEINEEVRNEFRQKFYIILNVAVGGRWPENPEAASFPAEMLVDYVRVYKYDGPIIVSYPEQLSFSMEEGDAESVMAQTLNISNSGGDSLETLTITEKPEWVTTNWLDSTGNDQSLDITINQKANTLRAGWYLSNLVLSTSNNSSDTVQINLQIGNNLAEGNIIRASSVHDPLPDGEDFEAGNANDGDLKTRWLSKPGQEEWIYAYLNPLFVNKIYSITNVNLQWGTEFAEEYEVQISNSKEFTDYTVIAHITDGDGGFDQIVTDSTATGKYIRIYCKKGGAESGYSIAEIEAYGQNRTDIKNSSRVPQKYSISNAPNPFNNMTTIKYEIAQRQKISLAIYDLTGRHITTLVKGVKEAGQYQINWNAKKLASGVYICILSTLNSSWKRKMLLLK